MSAGSWCAIRRKSSRRVGPIRIKHGGGGGPYVALPNVEHLSVLLTNQLIRIATRIPHELAAAAVPLETCRHGRAGPRRPPRHGLGRWLWASRPSARCASTCRASPHARRAWAPDASQPKRPAVQPSLRGVDSILSFDGSDVHYTPGTDRWFVRRAIRSVGDDSGRQARADTSHFDPTWLNVITPGSTIFAVGSTRRLRGSPDQFRPSVLETAGSLPQRCTTSSGWRNC